MHVGVNRPVEWSMCKADESMRSSRIFSSQALPLVGCTFYSSSSSMYVQKVVSRFSRNDADEQR